MMSQQHIEKLRVAANLNSQHKQVVINTSCMQQQNSLPSMNFSPNISTGNMSENLSTSSEVLPTLNNHNTSVYIMAGAAAGIMEHCLMYPVDSIKVYVLYVNIYPFEIHPGFVRGHSQVNFRF